MNIAIILPARDEGEQVAQTCASVARYVDSICVVDDASQDDSCLAIPNADVVRNGIPMGPAFCRNCAFLYDADCYIFADAHIRVDAGSLRDMCAAALDKNAIVCASVSPLNGERSWIGYGGRLVNRNESLGISYNRTKPRQRFSRITGLIGACYAVPANLFRHIGGWPETICWGYNEQALTIAAHMFGVPIFNDSETVILHQFKKKFNYTVRGTDTKVNRWIVHYLFFDDVNWFGYWLPRFEASHPRRTQEIAKRLLASDEINEQRRIVQAKKIMRDSQVFAMIESGGFEASRRIDGCAIAS